MLRTGCPKSFASSHFFAFPVFPGNATILSAVCTASGEKRPIPLRYTSFRCRRASVIPPGATDIEHRFSRRYGGRRTGNAIKGGRLRAIGFMPGNAVLGGVIVKLGLTQAIAFRWRK